MDLQQSYGFAHFLSQTDAVGKSLFVVLLLMSLATWYLIVAKGLQVFLTRRRSARFLDTFWSMPSLNAVERHLEQHHPDEPFSHLAYHAIVAARHHARHGVNRLDEAGSKSEFLTRSMRRVIDEETARLEWGLTVLASVGSTAPFVGLFGTVWGVYHALVAIGISGQGTLDKVAGPVGEALIMTGAGLAVAIPAVLAYNAFVRSNRMVLAKLDAFAHDLYSFLTTGAHFEAETANGNRRTQPQVVKGAA
ncbi:MAG: MotA/TolQ/ExbB proton channel family protein [Burkholderiales bacterium]|nr:MotA/TolQ/ExbB proton channel family protein [Burkholderiales bacterium]PZN06222.1 MAG: biopolymer transporter ExbB [Pseudomonadota bacterium]